MLYMQARYGEEIARQAASIAHDEVKIALMTFKQSPYQIASEAKGLYDEA